MNSHKVVFDKLSPEGKGVAFVDEKPVYVVGALPGEEAVIEVIENNHYREGKIIEWIKRSDKLISPKEDHYLTCSPLQSVDYAYQLELKKSVVEHCFSDFAKENVKVQKFFPSEDEFGYRNKLEFHFAVKDSKLYLAFTKRETRDELEILENGCELGSKKMNEAALEIVKVLNENSKNIEANKDVFKKLIIRESKTSGEIVALVLVTKKDVNLGLELAKFDGLIHGLIIALSSSRSSLANVNHIILKEGKTELTEIINGITLTYSYDNFFQNNIGVFAKAVEEIRRFTPESHKIVELYSGVGAIGLSIADKAKSILAYEASKASVELSKRNAEENKIKNYQATRLLSENISANTLKTTNVLLLDPPRAGLNPRLIQKIIESKPTRIIYLSCNPMSLARDFSKLKEIYSVVALMGFDFYPQTEHIESLLILDSKESI